MQKLVEVICWCAFYFFIWWLWNTKHHLHDFMVKCVILNVNRIHFYQEPCTVTLIQHKRRCINRLSAETKQACLARLDTLILKYNWSPKFALINRCLYDRACRRFNFLVAWQARHFRCPLLFSPSSLKCILIEINWLALILFYGLVYNLQC